jgi:hypothetical protein
VVEFRGNVEVATAWLPLCSMGTVIYCFIVCGGDGALVRIKQQKSLENAKEM